MDAGKALFGLVANSQSIDIVEWIENIYDSLTYIMRYTKGGISLRDLRSMDKFEIRRWQNSVARIVESEEGKGRGASDADDED